MLALGHREEVKPKLVVTKLDQARLEPGAGQQGPKVALVVIHLVIVQLDLWAKTQPEGEELQETFAFPDKR